MTEHKPRHSVVPAALFAVNVMKKLALCVVGLSLFTTTAAVAQEWWGGRANTVPREFRTPRFIYEGWREHGLPPPRDGQAWIHVCDSYILTSMRTGGVDQVHRVGQSRVDQKPGFRLADSFDCMGRSRYGYRSRFPD